MIAVTVELRELHERHPAKPGRVDVKLGDAVLLSTANGLEAGHVVELEKTVDDKDMEIRIIRILNDDDLRVLKENKKHARKIYPEIEKTIEQEKLNMKLTKIAYTYDRQKLFIYYTADTRVDFRKFIRMLGSRLKVRIQMVQIGVRDNALIVGGMGICGREICCHTFLRNIESVNIEMARNQQVSLNPENISGRCGRLLCCLRYENDCYLKVKDEMPNIGQKVVTPEGKGEIINIHYLKETVKVKLKNGAILEFKACDVKTAVTSKIGKWIKPGS
ncbi:stage 0 sporulation family protein [Elusimicrobiota bacterium]